MKARRSSLGRPPRAPAGIQGLDEITEVGLPKGRSGPLYGDPGCGKTALGLEFPVTVNSARMYSEAGVFVAFGETPAELIACSARVGCGRDRLVSSKLIAFDHVRNERVKLKKLAVRS